MKSPRLIRLALCAATLAVASVAAAGSPLAGKSQDFEDALRKHDIQTLAELYTEDGVILPPNSPRIQGRAGIAAYMKGMIDAGFTLELTPVDEWIDGRLAVRSGTFIVMKDGKEVDRGKWLEVWKRGADRKWLMVRDIWNSDMPASPPAGTPGVVTDNG